MTVMISGKHMEVGESLSAFTKKSVNDLILKYMGHVLQSNVTFSKSHHLFLVDLQVHISHHFVVNCHGEDDDAYRAVTLALEKLETRIRKYKDRLKSKNRSVEKNEFEIGLKYLIDSSKEDTVEDTPLTIAEVDTPIERLSVSEAVMRLEITHYPVLVFKNASNDRTNIVYRRPDNNIGWIDPQ
ncbi:MAG: ribosome-associated translation inhibitor RaiA [Proteobacteria bacterium]|nr:ribosome-associated translation inhibitor RaiA [Pseudomonadota bacterium]